MSYNTSEFRGEAHNPIRIANAGADYFSILEKRLPEELKKKGIPAVVRSDVTKSGGLFGSRVPMLVISHPNPPSRYFDIGVVVNGQVLSFPLLGYSAENTRANKIDETRSQGKLLKGLLMRKPDEFQLQQEELWQGDVIDTILSFYD